MLDADRQNRRPGHRPSKPEATPSDFELTLVKPAPESHRTLVPLGVRVGRRMVATGGRLLRDRCASPQSRARRNARSISAAQNVSSVEDLQPARLHGGGELIKQNHSEPLYLGLARRILQATDGRLRRAMVRIPHVDIVS